MPVQLDLFAGAAALPAGLLFRPDFIDAGEEARLLAAIAALPFEAARYKAYRARRRVVAFGGGYDFDANRLTAAPPLPAFVLPLRDRAAGWAGLPAARLATALVAEYAQGTPLGWHRDAPQFETVVGVSLGGPARMRLRRWPHVPGRRSLVLELPPRSAYVLQGEARWAWQHAIAATPALRYSITFRSLRAAPSNA